MARSKRDRNRDRNEIADAAIKSILKLGIHNCSLKDIADETGYTTGKLMYYFRDKEELIFYAKNRLFDNIWGQAKSAADAEVGIKKLVAMAMVDIPLTPDGIRRERLLTSFKVLSLSSTKARKWQQERDQKGRLQFQEMIEQLQDDGTISRDVNSQLAAFGINALIEGFSAQFIITPKIQDESSIRKLVTLHVHAMVGSTAVDH